MGSHYDHVVAFRRTNQGLYDIATHVRSVHGQLGVIVANKLLRFAQHVFHSFAQNAMVGAGELI